MLRVNLGDGTTTIQRHTPITNRGRQRHQAIEAGMGPQRLPKE